MEDLELKNYLAAWSDCVSLALLFVAMLAAGVDPRRRTWGRSTFRHALIISTMTINILFSGARLVLEGVYVETGPREFLLLAVILCARWIWLYIDISRSGSRSSKAFEVAKALRELKTVRLGPSTSKLPDPSDRESASSTKKPRPPREVLLAWVSRVKEVKNTWALERQSSTMKRVAKLRNRKDETELVIRRGQRTVNGVIYWRGVEEDVNYDEKESIYFVRLVEAGLHSNSLDEIGTLEYKKSLDVGDVDKFYKKIYELVMTCEQMRSDLTVEYSLFFRKHREVQATTGQAQRTGATSDDDLGKVARRVAADACYYVFHDKAEFRTGNQVALINECIENTAASRVPNIPEFAQRRANEAAAQAANPPGI